MKRNALIFLTLCAILIIGFNSRTPAQTILTGGGYTGPTTQNDVTVSRAQGTSYQNAGTTAMYVSISLDCSSGFGTEIDIGASFPATTVLTYGSRSISNQSLSFNFVLPAGMWYRISPTTGGDCVANIFKWFEAQ